jgi:type I restriction enzyme, S subunit
LNVRPGELNFNDLVRISSDGHAAHEKSQLLPGDVVVVRTGRPGEAAVVPEGIGLLNCIDLIVTTPGKNLNLHFFALFLNSATGRRSFSAGAAGTAQQHFNVGAFKRIRLPLPPIDIQVETVSKVEFFASVRSELEDRIAGLKMLMQSALQDGVIQ